MKIAIIEDDIAISQMYRIKFELEGYEVETAENGVLGLQLCEDMRPDIILLDIMMPEMSGDDMLEQLRAKPWGTAIKVVILTNKGEQELPAKVHDLDVAAVILKADMTPRQVAELVSSSYRSNMRVAILGFDTEGRASYDFYAALGAELTVCDQSTDILVPAGAASQLGITYLEDLDRFDVLVRTPGLKPSDILAANPAVAHKITSGTNEFLKVCPTKNVIGVTGTKGKGTTSALLAQMLSAAGQRVHLAGNIGVPALSLVSQIQPDDWVVLELSSFQLIDLRASPPLAACLMVVPEHLNWHADLNEYITAKAQLFAHQTADDTAVYYAGNDFSVQVASASPGHKLPYYAAPGACVQDGQIMLGETALCRTNDLRLIGAHNWQNACAAATLAAQAGASAAAIRSALLSFSGLPHRLEFVRELDGVRYYDDSFGTTPETAIVALQAFTEPKVIILGGSDKGVPFDELVSAVITSNVSGVITIGQTGPAIAAKLRAAGFGNILDGGQSMPEILQRARMLALPGSVVLLSTGCASFGMFANYKERGELFQASVRALAP